ncbi:hypothetical protein GF325_12290 [Candidatus Bathyarchaeota archaeon]|nr:hypothetical protein [Candidatus Bathyarchaeota archaeon]
MKEKMKEKVKRKNNALYRFLRLMRKDLDLLFHDPQLLILIVLLPISALFLINAPWVASGTGTQTIVKIGVINNDQPASEDYTALFLQTMTESLEDYQVELKIYTHEEFGEKRTQQAENDLYLDEIDAIFIFPQDFSVQIATGFPTIFTVIVDGAELLRVKDLVDVAYAAINTFQETYNFSRDTVDLDTQSVYHWNPQISGSGLSVQLDFGAEFTPRIIILLSLIAALSLTTQSYVGDTVIHRFDLTPTNKFEMLSAKFFGFSLISLAQNSVICGIWVAIGSPFPEPILPAVLNTILLLQICSSIGLSIGLALSTISRTKLQANQLMFFTLIFIMIIQFIGGIHWGPLEFMDFVEIIPDIYFPIVYKGLSVFDFLSQTINLMVTAVVWFAFANFVAWRTKIKV